MKDSNYGQLRTSDFWKGLIVAMFGSAFTTLTAAIAMITDMATFSIKTLLTAFGIGAIGGLSGYLSKNLFSNQQGQPFKKDN